MGDPPGVVPIGRRQQAHAPGCGAAPRRRPPRLVPHADLPVAARATGERPAGVLHVQRGIRTHLAAVPQIALIRGQLVRRRRHQHPIGGLYLRALPGAHDPAQPRSHRVDAQRIDQVLAAQSIRHQSHTLIGRFHPTHPTPARRSWRTSLGSTLRPGVSSVSGATAAAARIAAPRGRCAGSRRKGAGRPRWHPG